MLYCFCYWYCVDIYQIWLFSNIRKSIERRKLRNREKVIFWMLWKMHENRVNPDGQGLIQFIVSAALSLFFLPKFPYETRTEFKGFKLGSLKRLLDWTFSVLNHKPCQPENTDQDCRSILSEFIWPRQGFHNNKLMHIVILSASGNNDAYTLTANRAIYE